MTYLKCVLEAPFVVLYCVNSLLQSAPTGGLCGVRLTFIRTCDFHCSWQFAGTRAGAAGAGVYGYILLYDCATFRGPCCLPMWVM